MSEVEEARTFSSELKKVGRRYASLRTDDALKFSQERRFLEDQIKPLLDRYQLHKHLSSFLVELMVVRQDRMRHLELILLHQLRLSLE